jgi:hypothetical protein
MILQGAALRDHGAGLVVHVRVVEEPLLEALQRGDLLLLLLPLQGEDVLTLLPPALGGGLGGHGSV